MTLKRVIVGQEHKDFGSRQILPRPLAGQRSPHYLCGAVLSIFHELVQKAPSQPVKVVVIVSLHPPIS